MRLALDMRVRAFSSAFGFATLWVFLALARPGTTFHLAPLIVALVGAGSLLGREPTPSERRVGVAAGAIAALSGTGVLAAIGRLGGPSLLPAGGAVTEALLATLLGTLAAIALAAYISHTESPRSEPAPVEE